MAQNTIINDKIDYNAIFCRAVDTIVKNRISELSFDNTVTAEIIDASNASFGYYIVREKDMTYEVMSDNHKYKTGDKVYVTIPGGNYNNTKVILSAYKDGEELASLIPVRPKDIKILRSIKEISNVDTLSLMANSETNIALLPEQQTQTISSILSIPLTAQDIDYLQLCDSLILSIDIKCALRASYRYIYNGKYGLKINLVGNGQSISLGALDFSNLMGDPYSYLSYFNQYVVLNISELKNLNNSQSYTIEIVSFQNNDFQYKDEANICHYVPIAQETDDYIDTANNLLPELRQWFYALPQGLQSGIINNILFRNLKLNVGFNATNQNKTFNLKGNSSSILPIWYNYDETTGQEIGYQDGENLDFNSFYYRKANNTPFFFNTYWGKPEFRQLDNSTADKYNEYLYHTHLQELQTCRGIQSIAKKELSAFDVNNCLNTKEFLSIYAQHSKMCGEINGFIQNGMTYFDALKRNQPSKILKNMAEPEIISNVSINSYGADCILSAVGAVEENAVQGHYPVRLDISVQSKLSSSYENSNLIFLSFKYPKNIGLSFEGNLGLNVSIWDDNANLSEKNPNMFTSKCLYYKRFEYSELYDAIGLIYYNPISIFTDATMLDSSNRKQTFSIYGKWSINSPFMTDKLPISILGLSYPDAPANFERYTGVLTAHNLVTYVMNKENGNINCYSTAFKTDFNLQVRQNNIDNYLDFLLLADDEIAAINSLIPIGKDFSELFKDLQQLINNCISESKLSILQTSQPWLIDSKNYLKLLLKLPRQPIPVETICEWTSDESISWALTPWNDIKQKYYTKFYNIYKGLLIYCTTLWEYALEENSNFKSFVNYLPTYSAINEWQVLLNQLEQIWDNIELKRSNIISRASYCMPLIGYGSVTQDINFTDYVCSVYDWKDLNGRINIYDQNDFEFEFAKFLSFFKNNYNICVYEYDANKENKMPFILEKEWHLNLLLSELFNNGLLNEQSFTSLTINTSATAIRAILFYNHQSYKSNIVFTDTFDSNINTPIDDDVIIEIPIYNNGIEEEIVGRIRLEQLLDLINKYTMGE